MNVELISMLFSFYLAAIPVMLLRYFMYMDRLRVKKSTLVIVYGVAFALQGILLVWIQQTAPMGLSGIQFYKMVANAPLMLLAFYFIRETIPKQLTIYVIAITYELMTIRIGSYIEYHLFGGELIQASFLINNIVMLVLFGVTLPLMMLFYCRILAPALRLGDHSVWRFIWLIPSMYTLIYFLYVTDISGEHIASTRALIMTIPVLVGLLFYIYLLLHILSETDKNARLEAGIASTNQLLEMQREQYEQIRENAERVKTVRHDIRHQLAVIRNFAREPDRLLAYLGKVEAVIPPVPEQVYCENYAVNAVVNHYLAVARSEGAVLDVRLEVPAQVNGVSDVDLCVIFGNLLENAVEAGRRVKADRRWIRLRSRLENGYLSIVVENRFDGEWAERDGVLLSRKRDNIEAESQEGIGIVSVKAICERHDGLAKYAVSGDTFRSSAMVKLEV